MKNESTRVRRFFRAEPETRKDDITKLGAGDGVIFSRATSVRITFADIVKERGEKKRTRARDLRAET